MVTIEMAPRMAASVLRCAAIFLVLFVNLVFCLNTRSSFTREELMNIGETTSVDLFSDFLIPSVEYWTFWSKVRSPLFMQRDGAGEVDEPGR